MEGVKEESQQRVRQGRHIQYIFIFLPPYLSCRSISPHFFMGLLDRSRPPLTSHHPHQNSSLARLRAGQGQKPSAPSTPSGRPASCRAPTCTMACCDSRPSRLSGHSTHSDSAHWSLSLRERPELYTFTLSELGGGTLTVKVHWCTCTRGCCGCRTWS